MVNYILFVCFSNIACYAEVQSPATCLMQCEITIPTVYKGVPVMAIAKLLNQTLMPTAFEWGKVSSFDIGGTCKPLLSFDTFGNHNTVCYFSQ